MSQIKLVYKKTLRLVLSLLQKTLNTYFIKCYYFKGKININKLDNRLLNLSINPVKLSYNDFLNSDSIEFGKKKLNLIKTRLNSGNYVAYGEFIDGKLAYSTWVSFKYLSIPIINKAITLSSNEALLEDSYCHENFRGRGLHGKYNLFRLKLIYEASKSFALVIVFSNNLAAIKTQEKAGLVISGSFIVGKIFGLPFSTFNKKKLDKKYNLIMASNASNHV